MAPRTLPTAPAKKRVTFDLSEPVIRPDSPTLGFDDFSLYGRAASPEPLRMRSHEVPAKMMPHHEPEPEPEPETLPAYLDEVNDAFAPERPISRYCGLLSSLHKELTSHLSDVEDLLAAPSTIPNWSGRSSPEAGSNAEELRTLELRTRIERLRQNGWQRRRFDPSRYEQLRETALAELA